MAVFNLVYCSSDKNKNLFHLFLLLSVASH